jgi:hypothetical protein
MMRRAALVVVSFAVTAVATAHADRPRRKLARGVQLQYCVGRVGARTLRAKELSVVVPRFEKQREERSRLLEQRFGSPALSENDRKQFNIACLSDFLSEQHLRLLWAVKKLLPMRSSLRLPLWGTGRGKLLKLKRV